MIPFVDQNYRTEPNDRALLGWSLSGFFALYAMLQQPHLFKRIIAVSPGGGSSSFLINAEKQYARENTSLPSKLFIAAEATKISINAQQWLGELQHFVQVIEQRNYDGLEAKLQIFEGENHGSVTAVGTMRGLREVYS